MGVAEIAPDRLTAARDIRVFADFSGGVLNWSALGSRGVLPSSPTRDSATGNLVASCC
jgi:hypothetical protein